MATKVQLEQEFYDLYTQITGLSPSDNFFTDLALRFDLQDDFLSLFFQIQEYLVEPGFNPQDPVAVYGRPSYNDQIDGILNGVFDNTNFYNTVNKKNFYYKTIQFNAGYIFNRLMQNSTAVVPNAPYIENHAIDNNLPIQYASSRNSYYCIDTILQDPLVEPNINNNISVRIACENNYNRILSYLTNFFNTNPTSLVKPSFNFQNNLPIRLVTSNGYNECVAIINQDNSNPYGIDLTVNDYEPFRKVCKTNYESYIELVDSINFTPTIALNSIKSLDFESIKNAGYSNDSRIVKDLIDNYNIPLEVGDNQLFINATEKSNNEVISYLLSDVETKYYNKVLVVGKNTSGQLGDGTFLNKNTFTEAPLYSYGIKINNIYTKNEHCIAYSTADVRPNNGINNDFQLYIFGNGGGGRLGNGNTSNQNISSIIDESVYGNQNIANIGIGYDHTVFTDNSNPLIYVVGENDRGQLGLGDNINRTTFEILNVNSSPTGIDCGNKFTIFRSMNDIYGFGANDNNQLGSYVIGDQNTPQLLFNYPNSVEGIRCGNSHTVLFNGTEIILWGSDQYGQVSNGNVDRSTYGTITFSSFNTNISDVKVGDYHTIVLNIDGEVFVTGRNNFGQLGIGNNIDQSSFVQIPQTSFGNNVVTSIYSGLNHCAALTDNGDIYVWGSNSNYELGLGDNLNRNSPTLLNLSALNNAIIKNIAMGNGFTFINYEVENKINPFDQNYIALEHAAENLNLDLIFQLIDYADKNSITSFNLGLRDNVLIKRATKFNDENFIRIILSDNNVDVSVNNNEPIKNTILQENNLNFFTILYHPNFDLAKSNNELIRWIVLNQKYQYFEIILEERTNNPPFLDFSGFDVSDNSNEILGLLIKNGQSRLVNLVLQELTVLTQLENNPNQYITFLNFVNDDDLDSFVYLFNSIPISLQGNSNFIEDLKSKVLENYIKKNKLELFKTAFNHTLVLNLFNYEDDSNRYLFKSVELNNLNFVDELLTDSNVINAITNNGYDLLLSAFENGSSLNIWSKLLSYPFIDISYDNQKIIQDVLLIFNQTTADIIKTIIDEPSIMIDYSSNDYLVLRSVVQFLPLSYINNAINILRPNPTTDPKFNSLQLLFASILSNDINDFNAMINNIDDSVFTNNENEILNLALKTNQNIFDTLITIIPSFDVTFGDNFYIKDAINNNDETLVIDLLTYNNIVALIETNVINNVSGNSLYLTLEKINNNLFTNVFTAVVAQNPLTDEKYFVELHDYKLIKLSIEKNTDSFYLINLYSYVDVEFQNEIALNNPLFINKLIDIYKDIVTFQSSNTMFIEFSTNYNNFDNLIILDSNYVIENEAINKNRAYILNYISLLNNYNVSGNNNNLLKHYFSNNYSINDLNILVNNPNFDPTVDEENNFKSIKQNLDIIDFVVNNFTNDKSSGDNVLLKNLLKNYSTYNNSNPTQLTNVLNTLLVDVNVLTKIENNIGEQDNSFLISIHLENYSIFSQILTNAPTIDPTQNGYFVIKELLRKLKENPTNITFQNMLSDINNIPAVANKYGQGTHQQDNLQFLNFLILNDFTSNFLNLVPSEIPIIPNNDSLNIQMINNAIIKENSTIFNYLINLIDITANEGEVLSTAIKNNKLNFQNLLLQNTSLTNYLNLNPQILASKMVQCLINDDITRIDLFIINGFNVILLDGIVLRTSTKYNLESVFFHLVNNVTGWNFSANQNENIKNSAKNGNYNIVNYLLNNSSTVVSFLTKDPYSAYWWAERKGFTNIKNLIDTFI